MHATLPLLVRSSFPPLRRSIIDTLQVNLGYRCNQSCLQCHVNAGPNRTEEMSVDTIVMVVDFLAASPDLRTLDLTDGAPELNRHFRSLVVAARSRWVWVIDRCNLTSLEAPGQDALAEFLAAHGVELVASMPCYLEENVDRQRGKGSFDASIRGLQRLNALGYEARQRAELEPGLQPPGCQPAAPAVADVRARPSRRLSGRRGAGRRRFAGGLAV